MTAHQKLIADLKPDEALIWSEKPDPLARFLGKRGVSDILIFPIALIFFGIAAKTAPTEMKWFLGFMFSYFIAYIAYEIISGLWTVYAITSNRLIIVQPSFLSVIIESYYQPDIKFIKKKRKNDGTGNIVFATCWGKNGSRTKEINVGFFGITDVDTIESKIREFREKQTSQRDLAEKH